jgi:hypothetical protein
MSYPPAFYGYRPKADPDTNDEVRIDHVHNQLHLGNSFVVTSVVSLGAGTSFYCAIKPDGKEIHMAMLCAFSGNGGTVTLSEGATLSAGTPVTPLNRDRGSTKTSSVTFVHTPTITNEGTPLVTMHIDASSQSGTRERSTEEMILKSNTWYLIKITIDSGQTAIFSGRMDWYEITEP